MSAPLLQVSNLNIDYEVSKAGSWRKHTLTVVKDVSFHIGAGETYGLVGESGSGKSTIGKAILRLADVTQGRVLFDGTDISTFGKNTPLSYRSDVQAVFQDPIASQNPRHTVGRSVTDALKRHGIGDAARRHRRAVEAFEQVGLREGHLERYPSQLSGGQLQRVSIARALVLEPRLLVCDEALSALDLSTQSQIIDLLDRLQTEMGMSYLFIAHDLAVVRHISHRIGVLKKGVLVEQGDAEQVFSHPEHEYTRALLAATPASHPRDRRRQATLAA
ncbi:ATP-binding cassette domain-containing protein [Demequina sp. NBRC 110051]|uniref:ATP-binding cassette domain-containing protein n=1 Tax=Demequina sp. NBRC 110051 TaxID=1570340 RepID=UPI0009FE930F|nr:ATP-binding cassette domain-containing protein [Demequina sp. NBRC 110051]